MNIYAKKCSELSYYLGRRIQKQDRFTGKIVLMLRKEFRLIFPFYTLLAGHARKCIAFGLTDVFIIRVYTPSKLSL